MTAVPDGDVPVRDAATVVLLRDSAVGVAVLPLGAPVEVELVVEVG